MVAAEITAIQTALNTGGVADEERQELVALLDALLQAEVGRYFRLLDPRERLRFLTELQHRYLIGP